MTTAPGDYEIELTFSGLTAHVHCVVVAGQSGGCTADDARVHATWDPQGMTVDLTGSPPMVGIHVTRDGAEALTKTSSPTYAPAYPNGDKCDPLCAVAGETYGL